MAELLIASKKGDKINFKAVSRRTNAWSPAHYTYQLTDKDAEKLAYLLFDLHRMGYPMEKAFEKFRAMIKEPELFFLR
jgi:hypothetical protein